MSAGNPDIPNRDLRASDGGVRQLVDASPVLACSLTAQVMYPRQSRGLSDVSRSKRLERGR
jgi:hypothetical protein